MAQSTAGVKLYYGESTVTNGVAAIPASWTEIPDITSIPAMGAAPAKLETTTLAQEVQKTYINGLMDLGGTFEFGANMTPELIAAVDLAAAAPGTGKARAFSIVAPAPVSTRFWWVGEVEPVRPGEMGVDAVMTTTLYVSQETEVTAVAVS